MFTYLLTYPCGTLYATFRVEQAPVVLAATRSSKTRRASPRRSQQQQCSVQQCSSSVTTLPNCVTAGSVTRSLNLLAVFDDLDLCMQLVVTCVCVCVRVAVFLRQFLVTCVIGKGELNTCALTSLLCCSCQHENPSVGLH